MKKLSVLCVVAFAGLLCAPAAVIGDPSGPIFEQLNDLDNRVTSLENDNTLSDLNCGEGQIAKYTSGSWGCGEDSDTTYEAGNQLELTGSQLNVNEGSGSGLDADTLDGMHSTDFMPATGGDITGDLYVNGDIEADQVTYNSPRSHYLSIPQLAFQPTEARQYQLGLIGSGAMSELRATLVAPVYLPDGATVKNMKCYFYDTTEDTDLECHMEYVSLSSGNWGHMVVASSEGASGHVEDDNTISGVIDNTSKAYFVSVNPEPIENGWPESPTLGIKGIVIRYQINEAP